VSLIGTCCSPQTFFWFTDKERESGTVGQNKLRIKQERFKVIFLDGNDVTGDILNCQNISEK